MIELCNYSEASFENWSHYVVPKGFTVYTYIWGNYQRTGYTPGASFPYVAMLARHFARQRIKGMFRCGYGEIYGMEGPFYYVFNRLLENPALEVKPIVTEYCQAAFGPAAAQMLAFYERLNQQIQCNALAKAGWSRAVGPGLGDYLKGSDGSPLPMLAYIYSPDAVQFMESALVRAEKTPGLGEKAKRRLGVVRFEWTYAKNLGRIGNLYAAYKLCPSKASFAPLADAVRERRDLLEWVFAKSPTPGKIKDWPEYQIFGSYGRKSAETNGRMSALISAPLNWDVDFLERNGVLPGATRKSMKAPRAAKPPTLGDLDAGDWAGAAWQDLEGSQLQAISRKARAKALYDDDALYVVIDSDLSDGQTVKTYGHDGAFWADDNVELLVDPTGAQTRHYHFMAGPTEGSFYDEATGLIDDPLHPLFGKADVSWNAKDVTISHRRANGRWQALFRIPYSDLGASRPSPGDVWGLNLCRLWDIAKGDGNWQIAFWNPNLESKQFVAPDAMGRLVFE